MSMSDFYNKLQESLKDEENAGEFYASLAKEALTEEDRKTLLKMARQEIMHKAHLEGMLLEWKMK